MSQRRLIATLRNERDIKLDLLRSDGNWYCLRVWRTTDDGTTARVREISLTHQELLLALTKIECDLSAQAEMEKVR